MMGGNPILSIVISIIPILISIIALLFSFANTKQNKINAFQAIASLVFEQKTAFLNGYADLSTKADEKSKYVLSELASNYCNVFEDACALYLKKGINRELFISVFKDEIITLVEGHGVAKLIDFSNMNQPDCYINIKNVYGRIQRNKL